MKKVILALIVMMAAAGIAAADTIYLRDGRTVRGTLLGFINGRFVVRVDTRYVTPSGGVVNAPASPDRDLELQYFRPNEVERIEIDGRSLDDMRFETRTVEVTLGTDWVDSGVDVRRGERVRTSATGTIMVGRTRITPDGLRSNDPSAPLPRANEGELIGSIGDDLRAPIMELGSSREFVADRDGRLYLTANRASYTDARGAFTVQIRRERDLNLIDDTNSGRWRPGRRRPRQPTEPPTQQEMTFAVPGNSRGIDTNIDVRSGDQIAFTASGVVVAGRRIGEVGPEGATSSGIGAILGTRPVPNAGAGALIGYIRLTNGQTQAFLIGSQLTFTVPNDGRLFLAINDDNYSDNSGSFTVRIRFSSSN